jgi:general secretion pathway protein F
MAVFEYKAITLDGKSVSGVIDADTAREARDKLRRSEIFVTEMISLAQKREKEQARKVRLPQIFSRHSYELAILTRQLATLTSSGVPVSDALSALVEQIESRALQTAFRSVREKVVHGGSLADSLSLQPRIFSELYVNMVSAGEASGNLDQVLSRLADYLQKQHRLRARIVAALTYPIIMVILGIGVVMFLMGYLVPKVTEILKKKEQVLPLITEVVKGASDLLRQYWWALIIGAVIAYSILKLISKTESGRYRLDSFLLGLPVLGPIFKKQAVSRFAITMGILLRSGLPALESLIIVKKVVNNAVFEDAIQEVHDKVLEGADISTPLRRRKLFPPVVGYMVSVGEKSGRLEEMLERIADAYDEEIEVSTQKLTAMIEPVIIIFLAAAVGIIVLSVILPLVQLSKI